MKVLGLMSGTSMDGIDAALCEIEGSGATLQAQVLAFECVPYEDSLRERIAAASANRADVRELAKLNVAIGEAFAAAANLVFEKYERADLIGSHGQTVCHLAVQGATLQIGEPAIIAERTNVTTVANFRARDMACGGQGAPLVPYADWALLRHPTRNRIIQNIGGIGNCTLLPAGAELSDVRAWDTGPGNMVIDACARQLFGVSRDDGGALAARGDASSQWQGRLGELHPFFALQPPKTSGHEEFGAQFAARFLEPNREPHDVLAEVTWLTAHSIAQSVREASGFGSDFEMIVGGGGVHNRTLMQMLAQEIAPATLLTHEDVGFASDSKEALAFAILASETMKGVATNVPGATGANRAAILGQIVTA